MRKLEIIAATVEDAVQAQAGGTSSLELVQNLAVGGLTPSLELVKAIRDEVNIHLRVILRPHTASFVYSSADVELMLRDIDALKQIGVQGIVADTALPMLKGIVQRILTSGQAYNVWDGRGKLNEWIKQYGQDFIIACGGGIRIEQLDEMVQVINAPEYHLGSAVQTNQVVDSAKVRRVLEIINSI